MSDASEKSYATELFNRHKKDLGSFEDFETLYENLPEDQQDLICSLSMTYDFLCEPKNRKSSCQEGWVRDDHRVLGTISIVEKLMEGVNYQPFHSWLEERIETLLKEGTKKAYSKLTKEYHNEFGLARKVQKFFSKYLTKIEQNQFLGNVEIFEADAPKTKFRDFHEFGGFLYSLRSAFVHSAKLIGFFCPPHCSFSGSYLAGKFYISGIDIHSYLVIFEKMFIRHWVKIAESKK